MGQQPAAPNGAAPAWPAQQMPPFRPPPPTAAARPPWQGQQVWRQAPVGQQCAGMPNQPMYSQAAFQSSPAPGANPRAPHAAISPRAAAHMPPQPPQPLLPASMPAQPRVPATRSTAETRGAGGWRDSRVIIRWWASGGRAAGRLTLLTGLTRSLHRRGCVARRRKGCKLCPWSLADSCTFSHQFVRYSLK